MDCRKLWILFSVVAAGVSNAGPPPPNSEAVRQTRSTTQLAVLFVSRSLPELLKPSELVSAVRASRKTQRQGELLARFGSPINAQRLQGDDAPERDEVFKPGVELTARQVLEHYVLLEFATQEMAAAAYKKLQKDPDVLWVEFPSILQLSTTSTSDPAASQGGYTSLFDYQWPLASLNLFAAWDKARGQAYIGHIDTGVQTGEALNPSWGFFSEAPYHRWYPNARVIHPDLSQNFRPHRLWSTIDSQTMPTVGNQIVVDDFILPLGANTIEYGPVYRGHGTLTAGIIAANTSSPWTQAGYPNPSPLGISGVCWNCSLHVAKVSRWDQPGLSEWDISAAIGWEISTGAQVINLSLGKHDFNPGYSYPASCADAPYNVFCASLATAASLDVVVTAAAGNTGDSGLDFPASDSRTIAVASMDSSGLRSTFSRYGEGMLTRGVVAPGRDVLSTAYTGQVYDPSLPCGDGYGRFAGQGFGPCTGTSLSTPFITGIVGLMRSVNPLLSATEIKNRLLASSNRASNRDVFYGAGKPDALAAVNAVLADTNRLTPLFSLRTTNPLSSLYTTVPQVAASAMRGDLLPPAIGRLYYSPVGNPIAGYPYLLGRYGYNARAEAWIFTTHSNPHNPAVDLKPLYRLSIRCMSGYGGDTCSSYVAHVDHFYTTDYSEAQAWMKSGYRLDGIEGYVFPPGAGNVQPVGTVPLMRAFGYTSGRGTDTAIFPATLASQMADLGYMYLPTTLGYVYLNDVSGVRPTYSFP